MPVENQCCFGIIALNGRARCSNAGAWVSTFKGNRCSGREGLLAWCDEHKVETTTPEHGIEPIEKILT